MISLNVALRFSRSLRKSNGILLGPGADVVGPFSIPLVKTGTVLVGDTPVVLPKLELVMDP